MTNPHPGSCERIGLLVSLLADGAATPSQRAEIDAHLPGCDACRRAVAADAAVRRRLAERADAPAPAWLAGFAGRTARRALQEAGEARTQNRILWMSAAASLLVAVTVQFALHDDVGAAPPSAATAGVREATRLAVVRPPRLAREGK